MDHDTDICAFLRISKTNCQKFLQRSESSHQSVNLHFIIGNEAADLDSVVSSIVYAYHLFTKVKETDEKIFFPIINIPQDDFSLKTEVIKVFQALDLQISECLVFREELLILADLNTNYEVTLVDHNILPTYLHFLQPHVTVVIDHHEDGGSFDDAPYVSKTIEPVGSCCTLVAEIMYNQSEHLFSQYPISELLLSAILLDTVNLNAESGRSIEKDVEFAEELEGVIRIPAKTLFDVAQNAKFDMSSLSCKDMLRKDYKMVPIRSGCEISAGVSSVTLSLGSFLDRDSWLEDTSSFVQSNKLDVILVMFIHKEAELTRREILVFATDLQLKESICARLLRMSEYLDLSDFEVSFETQSKLRDLHVGLFHQRRATVSRKLLMPKLTEIFNEIDATDPMKSGVGRSEKSLLKEGDCESTNKKSESVDNHRPKFENCRGVENSEDFNHKKTELLFHGSTTKEHCTNEADALQASFSDRNKESSSPVSFKDFENDDGDNSFRQFEITEKQTFSCSSDESARNCSESRENAVLSKHHVASEGSCEKSFDEMDKSLEQPTLEFEYDWTSELYDMSSANKNNSSQPEKKHKIMIRDLSFDESNTLPALLGMDLLCPVFLAVTEDDQDDDVVLKDIRRKSKSIENICAVLSSDEEEFPLRRTKSELPMQRRKRVLHKLHGDARKRLNSISRHDSISEEAAFEENPFSCDRQFSVDEIDPIESSAECKRSISRESSDVISDKRSTRSYSDPLGCHENGGGKPIERFSFSDESFEMYETHEEDCDCSQCRKASFIDEDGYCSSPQHVPGLWERFITVSVGNSLRVVDLQLIEPYVKVISHGGFYEVDGERRVIMVFTAAFLPKKFIPKYKIIMEQLFYYVVHTLDLSVIDKYDIVYFNNSGPNMPGRNWLKGCYHMIARRLKKNLQSLYLVHPDFWLKAMVRFYRPFVSSKFFKKIHFMKSLKSLGKHVSMEYIFVPDEVKRADPDARFWF